MSTRLDERHEVSVTTYEPLIAHYAESADILRAFVEGVRIVALCGKIWLPTRDGEDLPICPKCAELFDVPRRVDWPSLNQ